MKIGITSIIRSTATSVATSAIDITKTLAQFASICWSDRKRDPKWEPHCTIKAIVKVTVQTTVTRSRAELISFALPMGNSRR
jgi:hypothetical protein